MVHITHNQKVSLDSCLGVKNDLLSLFCVCDRRDLDGALITEQRSERWLDESSSKSEENQKDNK